MELPVHPFYQVRDLNKKPLVIFMLLIMILLHEEVSLGEGRCFTHCGWENNNAEYIHLLTAAWTGLILDVWRWREFQQHRSTLWIVVIRHQVNKIWASSVHWCFYDGNKVCLILKQKYKKRFYIFLRKFEWFCLYNPWYNNVVPCCKYSRCIFFLTPCYVVSRELL